MNRKNSIFMQVVFISLSLHIIGLFALGGMTLYNIVVPEEADFEAPEIVENQERKEYKIKLQNRQKSSSRVKPFTVSVQGNPAGLGDVNVDVPQVLRTFSISTHARGHVGAGGSGIDLGSNALDLSMSAVDFFGIKSKGESIVFVVDVARSMLEPSRGDIDGF